MITLEQGVNLVWHALSDMVGGEIYVKKIPSMKVIDIANVVAPHAKRTVIGIRPGEKIHEQMIGSEDAPFTYEYEELYKILPAINGWAKTAERIKDGKPVPEGFTYESDKNSAWMMPATLRDWLKMNTYKIGKV